MSLFTDALTKEEGFIFGDFLPEVKGLSHKHFDFNQETVVSIVVSGLVAGSLMSYSGSSLAVIVSLLVGIVGWALALRYGKTLSKDGVHMYRCSGCSTSQSMILRYRCG